MRVGVGQRNSGSSGRAYGVKLGADGWELGLDGRVEEVPGSIGVWWGESTMVLPQRLHEAFKGAWSR
ncbi:unnamed protein product [Calypogeia fissa]